nr:MAG TPA: hypothetical protein [Siphoviridae sp. ct7JV2]
MNFTKYISYKYSRRNKNLRALKRINQCIKHHCRIFEDIFMDLLKERLARKISDRELPYILDGVFVETVLKMPSTFPSSYDDIPPISVGISRDDNYNFEVHINYDLLEQDFADEYADGKWRRAYDTHN